MSAKLTGLVERSVQQFTAERKRPLEASWSGASLLGGNVTIATVHRDSNGAWSVDPARSADFELGNRDHMFARRLHARLREFVHLQGISDLFVRIAPSTGPYAARPETTLCEGALYLLSGVTVHQVSAVSLAHWMKVKEFEPGRQASERAWQYAVAAAICSAESAQADAIELKTRGQ